MVAADARTAITFALSPGQAHDAPEGRRLLRKLGGATWPIHLIMDRAYEGGETRQLALDLKLYSCGSTQEHSDQRLAVRSGNV
jgi:hypothetical protein